MTAVKAVAAVNEAVVAGVKGTVKSCSFWITVLIWSMNNILGPFFFGGAACSNGYQWKVDPKLQPCNWWHAESVIFDSVSIYWEKLHYMKQIFKMDHKSGPNLFFIVTPFWLALLFSLGLGPFHYYEVKYLKLFQWALDKKSSLWHCGHRGP